MRVLIIEDEINAADYLKSILNKIDSEIIVLDCLESVEDSVNYLHQNDHPDLLFMDIQLSDGLSFEIFKHVQISTPVIFTTAFDQFAIEAFKVNSVDYLLKPIHIDDLNRALNKFKQQNQRHDTNLSDQLSTIFDNLNKQKKHRCLVKKGNHFEFINVSDVAFVDSNDGLTFLHTFDGKKHLYGHTVEGLMQALDDTKFFQINRGQIINIEAIHKIQPYFNQRMKIETKALNKEIELLVSRSKVPVFKRWVDA